MTCVAITIVVAIASVIGYLAFERIGINLRIMRKEKHAGALKRLRVMRKAKKNEKTDKKTREKKRAKLRHLLKVARARRQKHKEKQPKALLAKELHFKKGLNPPPSQP